MFVIQKSKNGKDSYVQNWAVNGRMLSDTELLTTETGVWNNIHSTLMSCKARPDVTIDVVDNRDVDNPYMYKVWLDGTTFRKEWYEGHKKFPKFINRYS